MDNLIRVKISGALFGQKSIYLEFKTDKIYKVKFQFSFRVMGAGFPNQDKNAESMLEIMREKQTRLML